MGLWLARDKSGSLYAYNSRPEKCVTTFLAKRDGDSLYLSIDDFPEVTWENSPIEVKLKCIK